LDLSCPIPISFLNLCLPNTPHFLVSFPINPSYFVSQTLFACVCSRPPAASCSHLKKPQVYAACLPWCSNGMPWTRHLLAPQLPRALWCELIIIIILGVIELMLSTSPSIFSILGGRGVRRKLLFLLFKNGKLFRAVNFHFVLHVKFQFLVTFMPERCFASLYLSHPRTRATCCRPCGILTAKDGR
jgi:hypothetical protein